MFLLLLLFTRSFASESTNAYTRVCNIYKDTFVYLQSQAQDSTDWTNVKTVAANACEDLTFDLSLTYRGSITVEGSTVTGEEKQITEAPGCDFEGIVWIVPDSSGNPTIDAKIDNGVCTGTDLFLLNYCVGKTLDAKLMDGEGSQDLATGIAYNDGDVTSDQTPDDISGGELVRLKDNTMVVNLCFNANEITTAGKAIYFICAGDSTAGFKGYKVTSVSGGTVGEIVQTQPADVPLECPASASSLFIWISLAFTLTHLF